MIDLHSHIIYGVDDGPSCIEQSLQMIEECEKLGIRMIVATSHYHETIFEAEKVEENFQELLFRAQQYDVSIKMGYEVFVNPYSNTIMKNKKKLSLNKSGRVLIEFPFNAEPSSCLDSVKRLTLETITPIVAHPERNRYFINNIGGLVSLIKAGCLIQLDAASITGVYGKRVKDFSRDLIQMNLVDVVASNAHYAQDYSLWYMKAYNNVIQWAGQESAIRLFSHNARYILEGIEYISFRNVIG